MTHTPGPWERHTAPNGTHIWRGDQHIADVDDHEDGHLIAAAPDGYAAACAAYLFCLSLPPAGVTRIKAQGLMCELRNYIASVTDKSAEDTQNKYELRAITKATGGE